MKNFKAHFKEHWVTIRLLASLLLVSVWGGILQEGVHMLQGWWQEGQYGIWQFVIGYLFLFGPFGLGVYGLTKSIIAISKSKDKSALLFPLMKDPVKEDEDKAKEDLEHIKREYEKYKQESNP